jgi:hypothetical protein
MTDFYYDGLITLHAFWNMGPQAAVHLNWTPDEDDLASLLIERVGLDKESMATEGVGVELRARVHITLDPYRAKKRGEAEDPSVA